MYYKAEDIVDLRVLVIYKRNKEIVDDHIKTPVKDYSEHCMLSSNPVVQDYID